MNMNDLRLAHEYASAMILDFIQSEDVLISKNSGGSASINDDGSFLKNMFTFNMFLLNFDGPLKDITAKLTLGARNERDYDSQLIRLYSLYTDLCVALGSDTISTMTNDVVKSLYHSGQGHDKAGRNKVLEAFLKCPVLLVFALGSFVYRKYLLRMKK